jgi:hypothetical protein
LGLSWRCASGIYQRLLPQQLVQLRLVIRILQRRRCFLLIFLLLQELSQLVSPLLGLTLLYAVMPPVFRYLPSFLVTAAQVLLVKLLQQLAQPVSPSDRARTFAQAALLLFFSQDVNYERTYLEIDAFNANAINASCMA